MDASDSRRGRPSTHRTFEREHRGAGWRGDPEQYGASGAILLGDLLLSWSDELLRRCGLPLERRGPGPRRVRPVPHRGDRRPVPRRLRPGPRPRRRGHRDDGAALQVGQVLHRAAAPPRRRARRSARVDAGRADGVRAAAGRGVPAPRRPARCLRRPGHHRQARRRRPGRGQAHRAGRAGPRRRAGRATPRCSTARSALPCRPRTSSGCAASSTPPARTRRSRRSSTSSPTSRSPRSTAPRSTTAPASVLRGLWPSAVTQRVV